MHFENLWNQCEELHQEGIKGSIIPVLDELIYKANLYKAMSQKIEIPKEELQSIKSRILGEILLTLTNVSLKDNINVFEALSVAANQRF